MAFFGSIPLFQCSKNDFENFCQFVRQISQIERRFKSSIIENSFHFLYPTSKNFANLSIFGILLVHNLPQTERKNLLVSNRDSNCIPLSIDVHNLTFLYYNKLSAIFCLQLMVRISIFQHFMQDEKTQIYFI